MPYAQRLNDIEPFRVVEVLTRARQLEAMGRDIVHMEAGEPDFVTAQPIIDAAKAALDNGATYYTSALGLFELRQKLSDFSLLMNPGDGLLMADPGYPCNRNFLRLVEGHGQLVPVTAADNYQLTAALAEKAWQSDTKGIIVASPSNPTGTVLSRQQLSDLHQLCVKKQGHLIVDEIYHGLSYGVETPSILSITDQAFVVNSFSKFFGMTGWRLGWLVAPENAIEPLERLAQNLFISMSTMAQYGALAGFEPPTLSVLRQRRDIFQQRRDFLVPALKAVGFDIACEPQGAFYIYANIERFSQDSQAFCHDMLENHGVALTPGADFGRFQADKHVRFSYTTSMQQLEKGVERLRAALK